MDTQGRRLSNLQLILTKRFDGVIARLAKGIGKDANQTRFILFPDKPGGRKIGEKLAREIEQQLGLPENSLDHDPVSGYALPDPLALSAAQLEVRETVAQYLTELSDDEARSIATLIRSAAKR